MAPELLATVPHPATNANAVIVIRIFIIHPLLSKFSNDENHVASAISLHYDPTTIFARIGGTPTLPLADVAEFRGGKAV